MAVFLTRALDLPSVDPIGFVDIAGRSYEREIDAAVVARLMDGCAVEPFRYCPSEIVTRGQAATFLAEAHRFLTDGS